MEAETSERYRAGGDRDLFALLEREPEVRAAMARAERDDADLATRRQLLATAMRLSGDMAPDLHGTMQHCRATLAIASEVETYVYPSPVFNAAAVKPERGVLFVLVSSSLLEAFEPDELRFVIGHELGHHAFGHHRLPLGLLLGGASTVPPGLALQLFAWQRYAEISSDRAGLACAGAFEPAARALFKLASGLRGGRVKVDIDKFVEQATDFRREVERTGRGDEPLRADWFASHPFSPLRVRALQLAAKSELMPGAGGMPLAELEAETEELMSLMQPSYLKGDTEAAEAMRRLLFAGAVLIAYSSGHPEKAALGALESLLGTGSVPDGVDPAQIRTDLPRRIARVRETVPVLRRAQVLRDLCVIARSEGRIDERERGIIHEIADGIGVDRSVIGCTMAAAPVMD